MELGSVYEAIRNIADMSKVYAIPLTDTIVAVNYPWLTQIHITTQKDFIVTMKEGSIKKVDTIQTPLIGELIQRFSQMKGEDEIKHPAKYLKQWKEFMGDWLELGLQYGELTTNITFETETLINMGLDFKKIMLLPSDYFRVDKSCKKLVVLPEEFRYRGKGRKPVFLCLGANACEYSISQVIGIDEWKEAGRKNTYYSANADLIPELCKIEGKLRKLLKNDLGLSSLQIVSTGCLQEKYETITFSLDFKYRW